MTARRKGPGSTTPADRSRVAVLGALSVEPMTGYELRRNIETTIGHFWRESFGQIYPSLASLEAERLITSSPAAREGSRRYRITATGRRRLRDWLVQLGPTAPPRNPLLLQLFFGRQLGDEHCRNLLLTERDRACAMLDTLTAIDHEVRTEAGYEADRPYWLLTIDHGRRTAQAVVEWADAALAALDTPRGVLRSHP
jgi:DNA-binding PadR family transcriptional regulator